MPQSELLDATEKVTLEYKLREVRGRLSALSTDVCAELRTAKEVFSEYLSKE